ncbi:multicopper oxidase domain-containing protein, partial [Mycobacterium sp. Marseille-P9652]|uniref:multicopper oxidase domain-containing protein n=1 Tax=Mycobacterium sp. Marseille-P9652 TaxID=2654950 RepID=UPI001E5A9B4A
SSKVIKDILHAAGAQDVLPIQRFAHLPGGAPVGHPPGDPAGVARPPGRWVPTQVSTAGPLRPSQRFPTPAPPPAPERTIEMLIEKRNAADNGFNLWTINGTPFSMNANQPVVDLQRDKRYRLRFRNASDDLHPMHLHRHTFEITRFAGTPTSGVRKDVAMLGGYQTMEVDFVADQPGLSLLHCHQQIHMDYGLMLLVNSR